MLKKLVSIGLLLSFLVYITPSEVLHVLTSHSDTRHGAHDHEGLRIDPEHHHCKLLQDIQKLDVTGLTWPMPVFEAEIIYFVSLKFSLSTEPLEPQTCSALADRAPPVKCCNG